MSTNNIRISEKVYRRTIREGKCTIVILGNRPSFGDDINIEDEYNNTLRTRLTDFYSYRDFEIFYKNHYNDNIHIIKSENKRDDTIICLILRVV